MLALKGAHESLKSHTGIDNVHRQRFETAVCLAVKLHEHNIPNLDNLWVVFVYEFTSRHFCLLFLRTGVDMNLGAWSTRTCIAHFPEVVVFVSIYDMVGRHMLEPVSGSLVVAVESFFL